jgi:hypothetical protein
MDTSHIIALVFVAVLFIGFISFTYYWGGKDIRSKNKRRKNFFPSGKMKDFVERVKTFKVKKEKFTNTQFFNELKMRNEERLIENMRLKIVGDFEFFNNWVGFIESVRPACRFDVYGMTDRNCWVIKIRIYYGFEIYLEFEPKDFLGIVSMDCGSKIMFSGEFCDDWNRSSAFIGELKKIELVKQEA